jgi:hypothetical protein
MRGRGLLIAAAIIQLTGAAIFACSGIGQLLMGAMRVAGAHDKFFFVLGGAIIAVASVYIVVSIFLLRRQTWAWIASLALDCLSAGALLLLPFGGVGLGELVILGVLAMPLFVAIGLLIGGRHAISTTRAEMAAEPKAAGATLSRDA